MKTRSITRPSCVRSMSEPASRLGSRPHWLYCRRYTSTALPPPVLRGFDWPMNAGIYPSIPSNRFLANRAGGSRQRANPQQDFQLPPRSPDQRQPGRRALPRASLLRRARTSSRVAAPILRHRSPSALACAIKVSSSVLTSTRRAECVIVRGILTAKRNPSGTLRAQRA
jgi:hypothetical protein